MVVFGLAIEINLFLFCPERRPSLSKVRITAILPKRGPTGLYRRSRTKLVPGYTGLDDLSVSTWSWKAKCQDLDD